MKLNRRVFLVSGLAIGGGLGVGLGLVAAHDPRNEQQEGADADGSLVALWIQIRSDNTIRVLSPHTEMGQGAHTGLRQIVAEELDALWEQVHVEQAPADSSFSNGAIIQGFVLQDKVLSGFFQRVLDNAFFIGSGLADVQMTGGSTSIRFTGWKSMRIAAAAARQLLLQVAANRLGVELEQVETRDGKVYDKKSSTSFTYGELAFDAAQLPVPQNPILKNPKQYRYVGKSAPRNDLAEKVFGRPVYGMDKAIEGMLHVAVKGTKAIFSEVLSIDNEEDILTRRGVKAVVIVQEGVAVVADNPWRAEQAAKAVKFTESKPMHANLSSSQLLSEMKIAIQDPNRYSIVEERGDVDSIQEGTLIHANYFVPFLAHATMETPNITIWQEDGVVHAACGVQNPLSARVYIAKKMGIPVDQVVFHPHTMGGGFGRRAGGGDDMYNYITQACTVFQRVQQPIKLSWSREMDIRFDRYRKQSIARYEGRVSDDGVILLWDVVSYGEVNIPDDAIPAYDISNFRSQNVHEETFVPYAYWRSVEASIHCFYNECFVDELAGAAKIDPIQFRLTHLTQDPRMCRVIESARDMAQWKYGVDDDGSAMGVAAYSLFGSYCCQIAKVSMVNGKPKVHDVWCAIDCGTVINPDGVIAQMEGGMIFGLSAALYGRIDIENGGIVQSNFHDYRMVRMADAPRLHVRLVPDGSFPGGVGEIAVPHLSAAVANAMALLTTRPRNLPLIG
ncbi:MAG: hypothetical protein CL916_07055 [Deltaproteobacteria bacterium]|nr:hypothetical protein [Deltaproteobacteria bacterium]